MYHLADSHNRSSKPLGYLLVPQPLCYSKKHTSLGCKHNYYYTRSHWNSSIILEYSLYLLKQSLGIAGTQRVTEEPNITVVMRSTHQSYFISLAKPQSTNLGETISILGTHFSRKCEWGLSYHAGSWITKASISPRTHHT